MSEVIIALTRADIDKMIPGYALDGLVSKEVFDQCPHLEIETEYIWYGVPNGEVCSGCNRTINPFESRGEEEKGGIKYLDQDDWSCPDYSTDLSAAMLVVEKLTSKGLICDLALSERSVDAAFRVETFPSSTYWHSKYFKGNHSQAAAEAICKAALKFIYDNKA